jgi:hypothetical protein
MEPKRQFRWLCHFGHADQGVPSYLCKTADKPSFKISETKHAFLNHTFYYPGRVEWAQVKVTIVDVLEPDAALQLYSMLAKMGYQTPDNLTNALSEDQLTTLSKFLASQNALGQITITQLDSEGRQREIWTLHNPWVMDVDFGKLAYDQDSTVDITITFRYDWATEVSKGPDGQTLQASWPRES